MAEHSMCHPGRPWGPTVGEGAPRLASVGATPRSPALRQRGVKSHMWKNQGGRQAKEASASSMKAEAVSLPDPCSNTPHLWLLATRTVVTGNVRGRTCPNSSGQRQSGCRPPRCCSPLPPATEGKTVPGREVMTLRGLGLAGTHPPPQPALTLPQGQGQDGSPGLEAFQSAKSLGDRFSLRRSAETLRSPADMRSVGLSSPRDKGISYVFIIVVKPSSKLTVTRVWSCPGSSYKTPNVAQKPWPHEPASKGHDLLRS